MLLVTDNLEYETSTVNCLSGVVPHVLVIIIGKQRVIFKFTSESGRSIRNSSIGVSARIANAT